MKERKNTLRKKIIKEAMLDTEPVPDQTTDGLGEFGDTSTCPANSQMPARLAALQLVQQGIFSFVGTRAAKIVQLGNARNRIANLREWMGTGEFYEYAVSRGKRILGLRPAAGPHFWATTRGRSLIVPAPQQEPHPVLEQPLTHALARSLTDAGIGAGHALILSLRCTFGGTYRATGSLPLCWVTKSKFD